jgi:hypothetical protein
VADADSDYFTSNEAILQALTGVMSILSSLTVKCRVRVYPQGESDNFSDFSRIGTELFLDADALWTMQELVEADILIMAKGCFSDYAALISDGIKLFEPRMYAVDDLPSWKWMSIPATDPWIPYLTDGSFNREAFERQLRTMIEGKTMAAAKTNPEICKARIRGRFLELRWAF